MVPLRVKRVFHGFCGFGQQQQRAPHVVFGDACGHGFQFHRRRFTGPRRHAASFGKKLQRGQSEPRSRQKHASDVRGRPPGKGFGDARGEPGGACGVFRESPVAGMNFDVAPRRRAGFFA